MPHPARLIPILAALSPVTLLPSWATPPARPAIAAPAEARPDLAVPGPTPPLSAADDPAASTVGAPAPAAPTPAAPGASLAGDPDLRPSGPQPSGALPRVTPSNGQRPSDAFPPVTVSNGLLRSAPLPEGSSPTTSLPTASLPLESPPTGPLPTGLAQAGLRAGWTEASGARILALELQLEPGWKTYWRSPGDSGLPPQLDWSGSENLSHVALHWPAPEPIRSGAALELGYHDRLVLPLTAWPLDPARPVEIRLEADLGLCRDICVPAALSLAAAPPAPEPDPAILHALARVPRPLPDRPVCEITPIADGLRVAMTLPGPAPDPAATSTPTLAAIEIEPSDGIWVSGAEIQAGPQGPRAVVEMVGPSNAPFPLDRDALRLTVLPADGGRATETRGCAPG